MGLVVTTENIRPFISNQATPLVRKVPGPNLLDSVTEWVAYGGCADLNTFDGVDPTGTAVRSGGVPGSGGQP